MLAAGIPNNQVTLKSTGKKKPRLHGSLVSLAEYGSFGVEFYALSERTGNATYAEAAETIYRYMQPDLQPWYGSLAVLHDCTVNKYTKHQVVGGLFGLH